MYSANSCAPMNSMPSDPSSNDLFVEDIISRAVFDSAELMAEIYTLLSQVQKIKVGWLNVFWVVKIIDGYRSQYSEVFLKYQKQYIIDLSRIDDIKKGVLFDHGKKMYGYVGSSLAAAMRSQLKSPQTINRDIVLMGLNAQQTSYENLLLRLEIGLREISSEISAKYQETNNIKGLLINTIMLILTGVTVGFTYLSIASSSKEQDGFKKIEQMSDHESFESLKIQSQKWFFE